MSTSAPRWGILPLALCVLLPACARPPRQQPLDPDAVLASVRAEREEAPTPEGRPLTLAEATALLRRANPSIREARATWQIAEALAQTKTPMPNPTIALGPLFFGGGNLLDMATTGFAAAVGWAMPTKNPPRLNDTVNRVRADAAFTRALATERSAYLGLRAAMAEALLGQREQEVVSAIGDATKAATRVGRDLAEAGQRTALDVRLLELEVAQNRATMIAVRGRARRSQHEVAAMLGRRPSSVNLAGGDLPALALELPEVAAVEKAAIAGHPRLAVLRAEYILAEKLLRQQAARANPGITFGAGFERAQPNNELGIPLGIELPIFDRNQLGLASAKAERDAVRARYRATLQRILGEVATAYTRLEAHLDVLQTMDSEVKPATDAAVSAARAGLDAGTVDALSLLTTLRSAALVAVERFEARRGVFEAWAGLEEAAGIPLLTWPDATESAPHADSAAPAAGEDE